MFERMFTKLLVINPSNLICSYKAIYRSIENVEKESSDYSQDIKSPDIIIENQKGECEDFSSHKNVIPKRKHK